jgi:hypothetical protein
VYNTFLTKLTINLKQSIINNHSETGIPMANISHNAVKHSLLSCQAIIRGESRRADRLFMQNKANLQKAYMSVKSCCAWDYDDLSALGPGKNKANSKSICPPLAGSSKHQALNPKKDEWVSNDNPKAKLKGYHLKKQSLFAGCSNERNIFFNNVL